MKFRPVLPFRFRDMDQKLVVEAAALKQGISTNEWILTQIESSIGQPAAPAKVVKAKGKK